VRHSTNRALVKQGSVFYKAFLLYRC